MNLKIPGLTQDNIVNMGATQLRTLIPANMLDAFLADYNNAIVGAFKVALIVSCVSVIGAAGMEWLSVKQAQPEAEKSEE